LILIFAALSRISLSHQYGGMMPDSLDFKGPFGTKGLHFDVEFDILNKLLALICWC